MSFETFVLNWLGDSPRRVLEVGCGPSGELALALVSAGHDVLAIDPVAPDGPPFRRTTLEELDEPGPVHAVVASLSLHHVHDLAAALDRIAALLASGGLLLVDEFAPDRYDEPTLEWLHGQRRALSAARGDPSPGRFDDLRAAIERGHDGLHGHDAMRHELDARFQELFFSWEPYLYRELESPAAEGLERSLIAAGAIAALGYRYAGSPR